mmetsp:Transcript_15926/g.36608  ORF Transcript_15926/g.36608 Transcript_15926/m.36608 type:complete len:207 (+) Transcript_15926:187-807(+)
MKQNLKGRRKHHQRLSRLLRLPTTAQEVDAMTLRMMIQRNQNWIIVTVLNFWRKYGKFGSWLSRCRHTLQKWGRCWKTNNPKQKLELKFLDQQRAKMERTRKHWHPVMQHLGPVLLFRNPGWISNAEGNCCLIPTNTSPKHWHFGWTRVEGRKPRHRHFRRCAGQGLRDYFSMLSLFHLTSMMVGIGTGSRHHKSAPASLFPDGFV